MATPEELNKAGLDAYRAGQFPAAVEAFEAAVALRPDYAACWVNLALAYVKRSRPDDAIRAGQRATALAPTSGPAHYQLANAFAAKGRWNEGVTEALRAWELDKTQFNALALAGTLFLDHGQPARAQELLNQYLAAAPADHPRRAEATAQLAAAKGTGGLIQGYW